LVGENLGIFGVKMGKIRGKTGVFREFLGDFGVFLGRFLGRFKT
jgi:hypothetical protein